MVAPSLSKISGIPTIDVLINGSQMTDTVSLLSASIQLELKKNNTATVVMVGGGIPGDAPVFNSDKGKIPAGATAGDTIEIRVGYDNNNKIVFTGSITSIFAKMADTTGLLYFIQCRGPVVTGKGGDIGIEYGNTIKNFDIEIEKGGTIRGEFTIQGSNITFPSSKVSVGNIWADSWKELAINTVRHEFSDGNWFTTLGVENSK